MLQDVSFTFFRNPAVLPTLVYQRRIFYRKGFKLIVPSPFGYPLHIKKHVVINAIIDRILRMKQRYMRK